MNKPIKTANDYAEKIIHGMGGWDDFVKFEIPVYGDLKVAIAEWTLRCLANNKSEGSELVINEIIKNRNNK